MSSAPPTVTASGRYAAAFPANWPRRAGFLALGIYTAYALSTLDVTSERFTTDFLNAIRSGRASGFKDQYQQYDVLIMDDVQFIANTEKTQEELFHVFNRLHDDNKQIVFSSELYVQAGLIGFLVIILIGYWCIFGVPKYDWYYVTLSLSLLSVSDIISYAPCPSHHPLQFVQQVERLQRSQGGDVEFFEALAQLIFAGLEQRELR